MKTVKCPFAPKHDVEMPAYIVFDTLSVGRDIAERVGKIIQWISFNKNPDAANAVYNILKANLGAERLNLFINMYLKTYDRANRKVLRFHPTTDETIKEIFYIFNTINSLIPALQEVAVYYRDK